MEIDFQELEKAFREIARGINAICEVIREVWDCVQSVVVNSEDWLEIYFKRKQQIENVRASWYLIRDNRKSSQVLMKKPRNLVRRIIR